MLIWSRVEKEDGTVARIGCILDNNIKHYFNKWEAIYESILIIALSHRDSLKVSSGKWSKWGWKMQKEKYILGRNYVVNNAKEEVFIMGDFNSGIG